MMPSCCAWLTAFSARRRMSPPCWNAARQPVSLLGRTAAGARSRPAKWIWTPANRWRPEEVNMKERTVHSARMQLDAAPAAGEFEILAITAGDGNGWQFSPAVLAESLALWDGCECFIDHAWEGRSLRDLAGVCHAPQFDTGRQGVRLQVKPEIGRASCR